MINKRFDLINEDDIKDLIDNEVQESKTIEYKEKTLGNSDGDKKEFLADISSFANASGGDIIYGIREKRDDSGHGTGIPESIIGLNDINLDSEIRRLEGIIQSSLSPRIIGLQIKVIDTQQGSLILIRVPKSWNSPHMVTFKNSSRFYARSNAGKYQLDIDELRSAFITSDSLADRLRNFRSDRIAKIIANETPVSLFSNPKIVFHLMPIESFTSNNLVDLSLIEKNILDLKVIYANYQNSRYNFDGLVSYASSRDENICLSYTQLFRNGVIEAVDSFLMGSKKDQKIICIDELEKIFIDALDSYLDTLKKLDINLPIFVMITLLNVKEYYIKDKTNPYKGRLLIDRDHLIIPETGVEDFNTKSSKILQPIFDDIWRACGWERSLSYDEEGNWKIDRNS